MAVNVSGTVQVGGVNVSAQVETHGVNATATVQRSNTAVSASVEHRSANVSATAQTRNTNVCASVNPHIMPGGTSDHAQLQNLGYDESGHTGFQRQLDSDNAGTGISIETDPVTGDVIISNTQTSAEWGNIEGNIEDQTDLNNILTGLDNDITAVEDDIDDIQELIPVQATSTNQLADKDFVNSSIATSTATFRGTYNVVTDLHLSTSATHQQVATALGNTISVADNNDYCFVEIPTDDLTPTETLQVDRYKYNGSSWSFEYTLNNSGYTSAQWKAINSGITSGKVTQYDDYATSKQNKLIAGNNITIDADGKTINSDIPQATSSVYGKVLLGVAGGAATYESVGDGKPICYPTTASEVNTTSMLVKSSVSDNGKILTENGFVYNTSGNPTISDNKVICDLGVGQFEKKLENLTRNTEYHIKSYGQNSSGLVYGSELIQMTPQSPIPIEYQLVEYLKSTGTQYIDTGYIMSPTDRVYIKSYNFFTFGARVGAGNGSFNCVYTNNNRFRLDYGTSQWDTGIRYQEDSLCEMNWVANVVNLTYGNNNTNHIFSYQSFVSYSCFVFGFNTAGNSSGLRDNMRLVNFKIYDNTDTLCRNMYPVYRISDNKPGMYDIVNNVFYINQGTGEFIVGPDKEFDD